MTPGEFRADVNLQQQWAAELRGSMLLQIVLRVLEDFHPAKFAATLDNKGDITESLASFQLGTHKGYTRCLETLKQLGVPLKMVEMPEPTYEEPPVPQTAA